MQLEKAENILTGMSLLARRVMDAVPKQDYWSIGQISNEMNRQSKHAHSKGEITGELRTLVDAGLVSEAGLLTFKSNVKMPEVKPVSAPPLKQKGIPKPTLMEQLFEVATTLREAAEKVETLAMEMDTAIKDAGKGNEQLIQLQATLRGLLGNG